MAQTIAILNLLINIDLPDIHMPVIGKRIGKYIPPPDPHGPPNIRRQHPQQPDRRGHLHQRELIDGATQTPEVFGEILNLIILIDTELVNIAAVLEQIVELLPVGLAVRLETLPPILLILVVAVVIRVESPADVVPPRVFREFHGAPVMGVDRDNAPPGTPHELVQVGLAEE